MGATTFMMFNREKARKARAEGKEVEAADLEKKSNKFAPNRKHMQLKDDPVPVEPEEGKEVEVDVDGDGEPEIVIKAKPSNRGSKKTAKK